MTFLILCVDRDNDFGAKTGVTTPIIGREENLDAAVSLGLADPEDTDTNALMAGVNVYDDLVRQGHEAEIATICGHRNVGATSDRILAQQLDEVLDEVDPSACILVTDGAEDEFVLPLVTSRVHVDAVKRVIVRQNPDIEGIYYVIKRALDDEKFQRTVFVPIALGLIVYGLAAITGYQAIGLGAIALAVGTFFIIKGLQLEDTLVRLARDFYEGLLSGRITLFTSLLSAALLLGGVVFSWQATQALGRTASSVGKAITFVRELIWWAVGSTLLVAAGRVVDQWVKDRSVVWSYWALPFSLVAVGMILRSLLDIAGRLEASVPAGEIVHLGHFLTLLGGAVIGFVGWSSHRYVQQRVGTGEAVGPDPAAEADGDASPDRPGPDPGQAAPPATEPVNPTDPEDER
jgi:putative membrane protein